MLLRVFCLKVLTFIFVLSSCSSLELSSRQKIYGTMALGVAGGGAYGFSQSEAQTKNAVLYGASFGLIASVIGLALFNEERKAKEFEEKLKSLEEELGLMYEGSRIKYLTGGKSYLTTKDLPEEIKPYVSLGEWHLFELEKSQPVKDWTAVGKNRLVKKNRMFELKAPTIKEE
ncbi:MAG: hypothetical protein OXN83_03630 [Oligoflexia bacterium]|nr:hypothetical protein [Oligoflexia bacterium]